MGGNGTTATGGGMDEAAAGAVERTLRAGALDYDRERHLPRLIRAVPSDFIGERAEVARMLIRRLEQALASERRRGRSRHWSYDLNRHIALAQALAAERALLLVEAETTPPPGGRRCG